MVIFNSYVSLPEGKYQPEQISGENVSRLRGPQFYCGFVWDDWVPDSWVLCQ